MYRRWKQIGIVCLSLAVMACESYDTYYPHGDERRGERSYEGDRTYGDRESRPDSGNMAWTAPRGEKFDNHLSEGYSLMAKQAEFERDFLSVDQFRHRAWLARQGRLVEPESLGARNLPGFAVGELTDARRWLMSALSNGAAEVYPWEAAQAQLSFDCWMEEQEENLQQSDIDQCRDQFYTAMRVIHPAAPAAPACEPVGCGCQHGAHMSQGQCSTGGCGGHCGAQGCGCAAPAPASFTLLFYHDKTVLTPESERVFEQLVQSLQAHRPHELVMQGHTDLSGAKTYNRELSKRRIEAIIQKLAQRGINDISVVGDYYGERSPAVQTADGVRSEANRRVEVTLR